ncbi:creatininase family protein [Krasilnikovia sp. MM14-A1259]|uniref:creatininase family protein n=1 Tax=Krasilnikovia sp. MM14-A1259 TaxID=3373539 RepID=UPI003826FEDC
MNPTNNVADMNWPEYAQRVTRSLLILPVGAIETHGAHLPLNTDTIITEHLARTLAADTGGLVLPTMQYGIKASPIRLGGEFPGNLDLTAATFISHVVEVLAAAYRDGARNFLVLYATYSNGPLLFEAAKEFTTSRPDARIMAAAWWNLVSEETRNAIAAETGVPRTEDHHSGVVETSLVMHMAPDAVRVDLLADESSRRRASYLILPMPSDFSTPTGTVYRARGASPEIGKRVTDEVVANLTDAISTEFGALDRTEILP